MMSSRTLHAMAVATIALAGQASAQPGAAGAGAAATQTPKPVVSHVAQAVDTRGPSDTASAAPIATHQPVVVELFTAQGCSSCPPADALLARLVDHHSVIPLALHVDYWDYIGWTDKFASPAFTERQKAYARAIGSRTIYTPQIIIAGDERIEGPRPMDVAELIQEHKNILSPVELKLVRTGDEVRIDARSSKVFDKKLSVLLLRYRPEQTVSIRRGENAGRTITYYNIVTALHTVGTWDGAAPISLRATAEGTEPVVVMIQKPGPGEIVAAAVAK